MKRSILIVFLLPALFPEVCRAQIQYPGPRPGPVSSRVHAGTVSIANRAISTTWVVGQGGPGSLSVRGGRVETLLSLAGDAFQIVLEDGNHYKASTMTRDGTVAVGRLRATDNVPRQAERFAGYKVEMPLRSADGRLGAVWRATARDDGNYVRQEIELAALKGEVRIKEIVWLDAMVPDVSRAGRVDGSVLVTPIFFFGCEDPMADNTVIGSHHAVCRLERRAILKPGEALKESFVVGAAFEGQMRRAFLHYLERERAHPYRPFLHYNSWYDISWKPFALNETNCLAAIKAFGDGLIKPYGVVVDAMVFDDGWDDPGTLWDFHRGFPKGFSPLAELARQYGTRLGVWLSPFGGYGEPRKSRLTLGREQGYETNSSGFSLAGPKYYAAFKAACVKMIHSYGVNYFKFDGIASGMYANGPGPDYILDTEAMRRLMLELRREEPDLYINLTTGSWPSPFWLHYADSVWRPGGDMGFAGKGSKQQQWLTYRDQETFRNIVAKGPLFPLNSLMTQGIAYSRQGNAGNPDFNPAGFKDDVRAFFGSGTSLQELYIQPGRLTPEDWRVLAEAAKWSRANSGVLVDTHWIGGDPGRLEVYGFASWSPGKGIIMLRNPDDRPQEFDLDIQTAFELPPGAAGKYTLRSPWPEDAVKPAVDVESGRPRRLALKPFEVILLEAHPVR